MTNGVTNELRLDLEKSTGETGYAVYQSFSLSAPAMYSLNIGTYSGTAGNQYYCRNTSVTHFKLHVLTETKAVY